jgi:hypothetical protein
MKQKHLHIASEAAALVVIVPGMLYVAKNPGLTEGQRRFLRVTAAATALVDGYLLLKWLIDGDIK